MCRWIACSGGPIPIEELVFNPEHSLVDQSMSAHLALTFGLKDDPYGALEKMAGFIEHLATEQGIKNCIQMTPGVTDGQRLYAVRYSTEGNSRTLFYSESKESVLALYPEHERQHVYPENARAVVSEPLASLEGVWMPIDESTAVTVGDGKVTMQSFTLRRP